MNRDIGRPISRQALGRTAFLGSLYDATRDEFCERSIVNDDIPAVAIRHLDENHGHSSYEFDTSVSKKLRKLSVDVSLSLSLLGGLVKTAGASSNYLYSRDKTTQQIEATFVHRSITRTESLNVSHKELKTRIEATALRHRNATHVVTSIRWGADIFAQLEATSSTAESKHVAKAGLKLELNKLLSNFISINPNSSIAVPVETIKPPVTTTADGTTPAPPTSLPTQIESGSAGPQISFESTATATQFNYKITLFGDLIPTTCPKNIDELIAMLPSITTGLQKTNGGKGRPLEYIMLPITEVAEILGIEVASDRIFRAVDENITHEVQAICDQCDHIRTIIHTIHVSILKVEDFFQEEEINQIRVQEQTSIHAVRNIRRRIGDMLIAVRSGKSQSSEFDQLLIELESQVVTLQTQAKQLERGDINTKLKYAMELKDKYVIPVREPDSLAIIQHRHPKSQLVVLYTSNELRTSSKDKWITVYFDFLRQIDANVPSTGRLLFCYFDYDLHPNFQPQSKNLEVREYLSVPTVSNKTGVKPKTVQRSMTVTGGVDSLFRNVSTIAVEFAEQWHRDAKIRLDEMFAKSGSRILTPYAPSLSTRHIVFEKLRKNQRNILLIGRSQIGKSTLKSVLADPTQILDQSQSYVQTEFPLFEQYSVNGMDMIVNFIDTPGLFQQTKNLPDNTTLMTLIDGYIRSKVTQLHFVCFCISMEMKVNNDDLQIVQKFFDYLGPEIRKNACLIITKCESKNERQLETMYKDAQKDLNFLSSQLKQGIFFTGSINYNDWIDASDIIYEQFKQVCAYRSKLLKLFIDSDIKPFDLTANVIGRKIRDEIDARVKGKLN